MRQLGITLMVLLGLICMLEQPHFAQKELAVPVDWKAELEKAQAAIKEEPKSAFWHNQASVAYDALGHFDVAVKELKVASRLDPDDPIHYYGLYALYKRKGTLRQQRQALLGALDLDGGNPLGHFELGVALEKEGHLDESLREYQTAKRLVAEVTGQQYVDRRGNPYEIEFVRKNVDGYTERVDKLITSKRLQK